MGKSESMPGDESLVDLEDKQTFLGGDEKVRDDEQRVGDTDGAHVGGGDHESVAAQQDGLEHEECAELPHAVKHHAVDHH